MADAGLRGDIMLVSVVESFADNAVAAEAGRKERIVVNVATNMVAVEFFKPTLCDSG